MTNQYNPLIDPTVFTIQQPSQQVMVGPTFTTHNTLPIGPGNSFYHPSPIPNVPVAQWSQVNVPVGASPWQQGAFHGMTPPSLPQLGQLWIDQFGYTHVWNGHCWVRDQNTEQGSMFFSNPVSMSPGQSFFVDLVDYQKMTTHDKAIIEYELRHQIGVKGFLVSVKDQDKTLLYVGSNQSSMEHMGKVVGTLEHKNSLWPTQDDFLDAIQNESIKIAGRVSTDKFGNTGQFGPLSEGMFKFWVITQKQAKGRVWQLPSQFVFENEADAIFCKEYLEGKVAGLQTTPHENTTGPMKRKKSRSNNASSLTDDEIRRKIMEAIAKAHNIEDDEVERWKIRSVTW